MWAIDRLHPLLAMAVLFTGQHMHAQAAPEVTEADIERAKRSQPIVTEQDIQRARERHRMPSEAELGRVPVPSTPRVDALPQPITRAPLDLEALARGFDASAGRSALSPKPGPSVLVFISFSMPAKTLERLADQAARSRATLVLRGLVDGSLVRTAVQVQQLIGTRQVAVQIDPLAFDRYGVIQTPSFVLLREDAQAQPCASGMCVSRDGYVMAAGDVSLDYALGFFKRSAPPAFAKDATGLLKRLKG